MKKALLKLLFSIALLISCLINGKTSFAQTVNITSANLPSNGITATPITNGQTGVVLFGFTITVSGGSVTLNQFVLGASQGGYFTNGKLYRSTAGSTTFSGSTLISSPGALGSYIGISGLNETITNSSYTYFLVADAAVPGYVTLPSNDQFNISQAIQSTPYTAYSASVTGVNFSIVNPAYTLTGANSAGNGITNGNLVASQTDIVMFGFGVSSNAATTVSGFNINSSSTGSFLSYYFGNGRLYRSLSSTFSFGTATLVSGATVVFSNYQNTPGVVITGLSEAISTTTVYYFLVADLNQTGGTLPANVQFQFNTTQTNAIVQSIPSAANIAPTANITGTTFTLANPSYTFTSANAAVNGITQGTITPTQTDIVMFGFGVSSNAATTVSAFNINSSSTGNFLSYYFGNGRLYRSASSTFSFGTATLVSGATVAFSNYQHTPGVAISGLSEAIGTTAVYYFLVADFNQTGGTLPANVQFQFNTTQTNAIVQSSPTAANIAPIANITGTTFTLANPSYTFTSANAAVNGITQGTITPGATGVVLFGVGVSTSGTTTISGLVLNSSFSGGTPQFYFTNGKVYTSTSSTFSVATSTLTTATIAWGSSASPGITITGLSQSITSTPLYFFIVADVINNFNTGNAATATIGFLFQTSQTNAITQTLPISTTLAPPSNVTGTVFTIGPPTVSVTGFNGILNGITQGALAIGQNNIVLFGFQVNVTGVVNINQFNIPCTANALNYFSNAGGKIYRSTDQFFAHATLISGTTFGFGTNTSITGLSESFNSYSGVSTYYYFITADFDNVNGTPTSLQYNFSSGTTSITQTLPYARTFNTANTTNGNAFSIVNTYDWIGGISGDFTNALNFKTLNNGAIGALPGFTGSTIYVRIGGKAYTNAPVIAASTEVGGVIFGSAVSSTLTINSGQSLKLNTSFNTLTGANATIAGPGTLNIASGTTSAMAGPSTVNLTGGVTVNNAGSFTMASTSKLTFAGNSTLANTGTFTLASDASSSANIGSLASGTVTGIYNVQRFVTGGAGYRGYRLLSSPVFGGTANSNKVYSINYIANTSYLTGTTVTTGGIDKAGNPTLYLFRENLTPNNSTFTGGNFRGVGSLGTGGTSNISYPIDIDGGPYNIPVGNGFLFFFRGDRSVASLATETITTYVPTSATFAAVGTINQGNITVKDWFNPTASTLSYTTVTTPTPGNSTIRGYNLVGNPYPSSISWTSVYTANSAGGHLNATIYEFNPQTNQYGAYISAGAGTGGFGDVIGSGQGFFAIANDASAAITFSETNKTTTQPATLLLGTPVFGNTAQQYMHLKLIKDAVNYDDVIIGFKPGADSKYVVNEDGLHLTGNAPPETLTTLSSDGVNLSINYLPLPTTAQQTVGLNVNATASGVYKFSREELVGIPDLYQILLKDNLLNVLTDIRANTTYSFSIDKTNAATFGTDRFQVIICQNPALSFHLLDFTAAKISNATQTKVDWSVENEANYTTFYVQRSTDNGQTFQSIGSLQGDGSGKYSFIDKYPILGQNQYRLQMIDVNNVITYSSVIIIQYSDLSNSTASNTITLFPNPARDLVNISIPAGLVTTSYTVVITNSSGNTIQKIVSSQSTLQNNVSSLLPGMYFIQVINNQSQAVVGNGKFIKI